MTDHRLTDKMIASIIEDVAQNDYYDCEDSDIARAAYDLAIEHVYETWKQTVEVYPNGRANWWVFDQKLKAMLPQQQEKIDNTVQDTELIQRAMRYWENN